MRIEYQNIADLIPYENNPRNNEAAVRYVANSIREFGFKVPIIIDRNHVIVAGHARLKAAEHLGLNTVPCIIADDLTEEQIRAFRLADNKVAEKATWNVDLLEMELDSIMEIDMLQFDFDVSMDELDPDPDPDSGDGYYGDERERTNEIVNLDLYDQFRTDGFYQMPVIRRCDYVPDSLIGFNYVLTAKDFDTGVHFFIDDYQFERVWNDPRTYIQKLMLFECVLTPDFSLYMDMPQAMKVWNVYRSRLIGQLMQDTGIKVIPTLQWAEPETFQFCFDGIEPGGTVAVSTVGVMRDPDAIKIWKMGMDEAIQRLDPSTIVCYGSRINYDFGNIPVKYIEARKGWE